MTFRVNFKVNTLKIPKTYPTHTQHIPKTLPTQLVNPQAARRGQLHAVAPLEGPSRSA